MDEFLDKLTERLSDVLPWTIDDYYKDFIYVALEEAYEKGLEDGSYEHYLVTGEIEENCNES